MSSDKTNDIPVFVRRALNVSTFDNVTLLDAVSYSAGGKRRIHMFFKAGQGLGDIEVGEGFELETRRTIGGALVLQGLSESAAGGIDLSISGNHMKIDVMPAEKDLFSGLNVGFAVRNGETAGTTLDWLRYHVMYHGMTGALILSRSRTTDDDQYAADLTKGIAKIPGLERVVLLGCDVPLGQADLPPESHPFNVFGAPGKDRMDLPENDPWSAPLGDVQIYELARVRFLGRARAVMNIDIYDLLDCNQGKNIFDNVVETDTGYINLDGVQCYPWRIRKGKSAAFGDHICIQFDAKKTRRRWCVAPCIIGENTVWRLIRVVGAEPDENHTGRFYRHMALRHPTESVSKIVPKSSLIEDDNLIDQAKDRFSYKPVRMPIKKLAQRDSNAVRTTVVTAMKNEGPFILEWIAYHRAIGVTDFLVYTNDCTDGTDDLLNLLQQKSIVQHRENPFRDTDQKPQQAALKAAGSEAVVKDAAWLICMDVDEFINIHVGDGTLGELYEAVGKANMIALTWRLFGNSNIHEFEDKPLCENFNYCAPELARKPHQAWGFKTLYRNLGIFKKLGVHRPKGLNPQHWEAINWVNGSGAPLPNTMYRNAWRSTLNTYGYDLVTLNHYAVRSVESFLVKRDRGRVNHVDRGQGLAYWFRMNNNAESNETIHKMLPAMRAELERLKSDPEIAEAHAFCVKKHREKINALREPEMMGPFFDELTSFRMERLSKMHEHFGANVFLSGPNSVPDEILEKDLDSKFTFTVQKGMTEH